MDVSYGCISWMYPMNGGYGSAAADLVSQAMAILSGVKKNADLVMWREK